MFQDLFNNRSNDYIYPDLPQCAGSNDVGNYRFEFLPNKQIGIITGSDIVSSMGLSEISQNVSGWNQQCKMLQPGEIFFVQGLTKGISNKTQYFLFDGSVSYTGSNHSLYMSADVSITYFSNFKASTLNVFVSSDPNLGISIDNAFNMKFSDLGINVDVTYDPSGLIFTSSMPGYDFNLSNIDVSTWEPDSSIYGKNLNEDTTYSIPAFKYPNSAMLGYVLKVTYPSIANEYESYININHVPDFLEHFTPEYDSSMNVYYIRHYDAVDVGASISCAEDTISAGDYLNYIDVNNKWEKVGILRMWLSTQDPGNSIIENLITGFYVYNPQSFPVQICYMVIV